MTPLVSCLMVTKTGREKLARRAIADWSAQTYPLRELIIVASTPEAFSDLPRNVVLVRDKRGVSLGGVRAQSVDAATGDVVAIWDDDDGHAPDRLRRQVDALAGADACVLWRVNLECVCGYTVYSARRSWESTLVARRSVLPTYQDLDHGEDVALMDDLRERCAIRAVDAPELYRYRFWGGNACAADHWMDLFSAVGKHDCWKCAADRGLLDPESTDAKDLVQRIERAVSTNALARVSIAIDALRSQHAVPPAGTHALLAARLAAAHAQYGDSALARVWALRAMRDGPRADTLCLLGELAANEQDYACALAWYDAARAAPVLVDGAVPRLVAERIDRCRSLRILVRPTRSVSRIEPSPGHVLAVMSCAGRGESLRRTLVSLAHAGVDRWDGPKLLVYDGAMDSAAQDVAQFLERRGWHIVLVDVHSQALTFLRVLSTAAVQDGFQNLTMFEDDIVLAENSLDYIRSVELDPDLALLSWFTTNNAAARISPSLHITAAAQYLPSNQAITLPAATVRAVVASKRLEAWPERHGADRIFREIPGTPCAIHYPNLVQHVGADSRVGNSGSRISPTFPGEDFDALGLLR